MAQKVAVSPIQAHIRRLPGTYFLAAEVARNLDIPIQTVHMWRSNPESHLGPSERTLYRGRWVSLYTEADVRRIVAYRVTRIASRPAMQAGGPGRKRLWSEIEAADRNRRNNRAVYHRHRAVHFAAEGLDREAMEHAELAEALRIGLNDESEARRALVGASLYYTP